MYKPVPFTCNVHLKDTDDAGINLELIEAHGSIAAPYPRLHIGPLTIFASNAQLEQIEKCITLYFARLGEAALLGKLAAHSMEEAAKVAVVESQRCDHCRQTFIGEPGQSTADTVLCPGCVDKVNAALRDTHPEAVTMRGVPVPYQP